MVRGYEADPYALRTKRVVFFSEFSNRIAEMYPQIFKGGGTSEGSEAADFWYSYGWYASFVEVAKDLYLDIDVLTEKNVHYFLKYLGFKMDKAKLEANIRAEQQGKNVTRL